MKKKNVRPPRQNVWVSRAVIRGIRTGCRWSQMLSKIRDIRVLGVSEKSCRNIDVQSWEPMIFFLSSSTFAFIASFSTVFRFLPLRQLQVVRNFVALVVVGGREQH